MRWTLIMLPLISCVALASDVMIPTEDGWRRLTGREAKEYQQTQSYLQARLREAESVKIGSTYADLTRYFKRDGGISPVYQHRFVMILCPMIKVDVEFEVKGAKSKWPINPTAKITKISKPYLQAEVLD